MLRLKSKLLSLNTSKPEHQKTKIYSPANTEELRIPFRLQKTARVVGRLAELSPPTSPEDTRLMNGVLVQNDFKLSLMAPEDLREYAGLTTTTLHCKQRLTLSAAGIDLIKWALEGTFGAIEDLSPKKSKEKATTNGVVNGNTAHDDDVDDVVERSPDITSFLVMGCVIVRYENAGEVSVEWEGNMLNDGIADAVLAVLFSVESSPAAVKQSAQHNGHTHSHHDEKNVHANVSAEERFSRLCMFLEAQFGDQIKPITTPKIVFKHVKEKKEEENGVKGEEDVEEEMTQEEIRDLEAEELERLHSLGIPVPGVEIKVDKNVAKVWLEDLEVECRNAVMRDRVKAVVERAVETVAPLWAARG